MLKSIWLIDDSKTDNFFHQRILQKCEAAHEIRIIGSAHQAMNFLKEQDPHPELIIVDVHMPLMSGWEFIRHYSDLFPKGGSRFVLMSGTDPNPNQIGQMKDLVLSYTCKPLTVDFVKRILQHHLQ